MPNPAPESRIYFDPGLAISASLTKLPLQPPCPEREPTATGSFVRHSEILCMRGHTNGYPARGPRRLAVPRDQRVARSLGSAINTVNTEGFCNRFAFVKRLGGLEIYRASCQPTSQSGATNKLSKGPSQELQKYQLLRR